MTARPVDPARRYERLTRLAHLRLEHYMLLRRRHDFGGPPDHHNYAPKVTRAQRAEKEFLEELFNSLEDNND